MISASRTTKAEEEKRVQDRWTLLPPQTTEKSPFTFIICIFLKYIINKWKQKTSWVLGLMGRLSIILRTGPKAMDIVKYLNSINLISK